MASNSELIAIWVDVSIGEDGAFGALKDKFRRLSTAIRTWHFIDNDDKFRDLIDGNSVDQLILIMSGNCAKRLLGSISARENIHSVYIFCSRKEKYDNMAKEEPKIRQIFVDENEMFDEIQKNVNAEFL